MGSSHGMIISGISTFVRVVRVSVSREVVALLGHRGLQQLRWQVAVYFRSGS
jgi:hypothetical protein